MILSPLIGAALALAGVTCVAPQPVALESAPEFELAEERCSCRSAEDPREEFNLRMERADVVVEGTVVSVDTMGGPIAENAHDEWEPGDPQSHPIVATLAVHRGWKGEPVDTVQLLMWWVVGFRTSCDQSFDEGERLLLFGRALPAGDRYSGRSCTGTTRFDDTRESVLRTLEFLGDPLWVPTRDRRGERR